MTTAEQRLAKLERDVAELRATNVFITLAVILPLWILLFTSPLMQQVIQAMYCWWSYPCVCYDRCTSGDPLWKCN